MNAKQRKQTEKMRERAMLDAGGVLARIEAEKKNLEALRKQHHEDAADAQKALKELQYERATFKKQQEDWSTQKSDAVKQRLAAVNVEMAAMREQCAHYEDGKILREVLLALEMDISPEEIAAKLRRDNQLLVPQW